MTSGILTSKMTKDIDQEVYNDPHNKIEEVEV